MPVLLLPILSGSIEALWIAAKKARLSVTEWKDSRAEPSLFKASSWMATDPGLCITWARN